jgi:hypothetical protein
MPDIPSRYRLKEAEANFKVTDSQDVQIKFVEIQPAMKEGYVIQREPSGGYVYRREGSISFRDPSGTDGGYYVNRQ